MYQKGNTKFITEEEITHFIAIRRRILALAAEVIQPDDEDKFTIYLKQSTEQSLHLNIFWNSLDTRLIGRYSCQSTGMTCNQTRPIGWI